MKNKTTRDSFFAAPALTKAEKHDFYSSLSHIFRGPLVGATGYVDYLFKGYAGTMKPDQLRQLGRARESVLQLNGVIDTFLDMVAFDLGLIESGSEKTELRAKLLEMERDLKDLLSQKKIALRISVPDRPLTVKMEQHWVKVMLYELIASALYFLPQDGAAELEIAGTGKTLRMELRYLGITCQAKRKNDIFRPFFQFTGPNCPSEGGRRGGLGLSLVQRIVSLHAGKIKADNDAAGGLKICIELPLKD